MVSFSEKSLNSNGHRAGSDVIRIDRLVVRYGRFTAVDGLSLTVGAGELFGFLGPNGAGKTTTIRVLIGGLWPSGGRVDICGVRVPQHLDRVKPLFGYVPDTENHIEEFTGRQNLQLFAGLYGLNADDVERVLAKLELYEAADVPVRGYSKGMRKKLLIASEIMHQPRILYLDEPTANLDSHSTELVRQMLRELASSGVTVFITTHDMTEVEEICDRVAILSRGKLVDCDSPANFMTRHAERKVSVQYEKNDRTCREELDLDAESERARLAGIVQHEKCVRLHSQEFDFEDVFRKLTGQAYT